MPEIHIKMYEGRTQAQKDEIVEVFTREISRILDRDPKATKVSFTELPLDENAPANIKR